MEETLGKSLSFILFILIGVLLKKKFTKEEVKGLKNLILTLALPAMIFVALLKIDINKNLLILPLLALIFNGLLFGITPILLILFKIPKTSSIGNSIKLLFPSLAPGLSCFPFIAEFLGEEFMAKAAMADLGNKLFVLLILYLVAISWFYKNNSLGKESTTNKVKSLLKSLVLEPVNLFIFVALILISFGIHMSDLPNFLSKTLTRLSLIMTPLVLLFIGLAIKLKRHQIFQILSILLLRASVSLLIVGLFVTLCGITTNNEVLFILAFSLSACSFWPFAHMASINLKETDLKVKNRTFDTEFALAILALSLPLSVGLILGILSVGNTFSKPINIFLLASLLFTLGSIFPLLQTVSKGLKKNVFKRVKQI